jgi:ABC-type multidrug transport system permease subunit
MRMRTFWREPGTLFWVFAFPLLISLALGLAFRRQGTEPLGVVVVGGASDFREALSSSPDLRVAQRDEASARDALRRGDIALVVLRAADGRPELVFDPVRLEARAARTVVLRTLETQTGRVRELPHRDSPLTTPGSRYIDFLIPGMLGLNLMTSGIWGLGYGVAQMRKQRLLKRLAATPMRRGDFLVSYLLARMVLAVGEILFFVFFARLLFGVEMFGSWVGFLVVGLTGAVSFSALALLIGSRAENTETASGLANLAILPMTLLSGVFFPVSHFPDWLRPILQALPLTALNDGLRAVMTDGRGLATLGIPIAVLTVWGVVSFGLALRLFKWT